MAYIILTILISVACIGSAVADWKRVPAVMESLERLKVPTGLRPALPILKLLGAAGLIVGLSVKGLGVFAAFCLVGYFFGAVLFHSRAKDPSKEMIPAAVLLLLCLAAFLVRATTV